MKNAIKNGTGIFEFVEDKLDIAPVGLIPLDNSEGYFFLNNGHHKDTHVYQYRLTFFEKQDEKYRGIKADYIDCWHRSFSSTYEHIKSELIKKKTDLPNPAVYALETSLSFPVEETLLPIAKRCLVKFISSAAWSLQFKNILHIPGRFHRWEGRMFNDSCCSSYHIYRKFLKVISLQLPMLQLALR